MHVPRAFHSELSENAGRTGNECPTGLELLHTRDIDGLGSDASSPVSSAQERLAIAVLTVGAFVVSVNVQLVGALGPYILADPLYRDLSEVDGRTTLTQLMWITAGATALTSLLLGPVVDRIGRRGPVALGSLLFAIAFSFTTFTTLGFGDIVPHGDLRFLTGIESLTGLVLITWTASFLYLEMQRYWNSE